MSVDSLQQALRMRGRASSQVLFGQDKGENKKDLPSITDTRYLRRQEGFMANGTGRLKKLKGCQLFKTIDTIYTDDKRIFIDAYDDRLMIVAHRRSSDSNFDIGYYNPSNGEIMYMDNGIVLTTSDKVCGANYGRYYYIAAYRAFRVSEMDGTMDLAYDNLAGGTFTTTGSYIIEGATSGYTATIIADATSTLTLTDLEGNFIDGEQLIEKINGVATGVTANANGILTKGITWGSSPAPAPRILKVKDKRLLAGDTYSSITNPNGKEEIHASAEDTGSGITDWTIGTGISDGFKSRYPAGGRVNGIGIINNQIISIGESGKHAFRIDMVDDSTSGLQLRQIDDYARVDFGGLKNALSIEDGIFYVNDKGAFWIAGSLENKASEVKITALLGDEIDEYNFDNADIEYYEKENWVVITCSHLGTENNALIIFNKDTGEIGKMTGIHFESLCRFNGDVYGTSDGSIYRLFDGYDHDGNNLYCKMETVELDFGSSEQVKDMKDLYIIGKMAGNTVTIKLDIWDQFANLTEEKKVLEWTPDTAPLGYLMGYDQLEYSGSDTAVGDSVAESFGHVRVRLKKFTKLRIRIEEDSMFPLEINRIILGNVSTRKEARKNNIVEI